MSPQNRIYVTLSPRMRKALELCAALDGSTPASYAGMLMSSALTLEIEKHPALQERWVELEREALLRGSWDTLQLPGIKGDEAASPLPEKMPGWLLTGSHSGDYEYGIDADETYQGKPSGSLRSKADEAEGFGTLMQMFKAEEYLGKHLRFSAQVKSEGVESWAGLWMRVDGLHGHSLSFDNMYHRPIQGTRDWQSYEIVLEVPEESTEIAFGILLNGPGQVWINEIQFSEVGNDVPITSAEFLDKPTNLDFTIKPT
ncbi:MAG: hypothetical protein M3Z24_11435 [Chloroflexota bacterium]|nr:hypothetical protein [Chloroflexota bacterium]